MIRFWPFSRITFKNHKIGWINLLIWREQSEILKSVNGFTSELKPYRQLSVGARRNQKLSPCYYGPFQVIGRIGKVAYRLDLSSKTLIHPVFHVSCLKKHLGSRLTALPILPPIKPHGSLYPEPERILQRRLRQKGNRATTDVLVKWIGMGEEDATWEEYVSFQRRYPGLVDKVFQRGESSVMYPESSPTFPSGSNEGKR